MGKYRRTVSFPNPPTPSLRGNRPATKAYHVRSASLPCGRTHPLIPQLQDEVSELRAWEQARAGHGSGAIVDGLARLKSVLDSLDNVLQLPLTQDSLSFKTEVVDDILEDFLRFVDAYGIFRASMLGLKQEISGAQVALRRKDESKLGLYIKAQKKIASEVGKLVLALSSIAEQPTSVGPINTLVVSDFEDELEHVIRDVHRVTVSVSEAIFGSVSGSFGPCRRPTWANFGLCKKLLKKDNEQGLMIEEFQKVIGGVENFLELRKNYNKKKNNINYNNNNNIEEEEKMRMGVLKGMQELEDCVGEMEKESERVFRSLISTRVSLLNILTHA